MKNIFSFKVSTKIFRVRNMILFYQSCERMGETVYLYGKGKMEQVKKLPQFLSFLLVTLSKNDDCLIVVEGEHMNPLKKMAAQMLNPDKLLIGLT